MNNIWTSGSGRIELELTSDNIDQGSHCGDCFDDLAALIKMPEISKQFDLINPDVIRTELKEYGAWDEMELKDGYMNKCRLLWIAAGDLSDEQFR